MIKPNYRIIACGILITLIWFYLSPKTELPVDDHIDHVGMLSYTGLYDLKVSEAASAVGFSVGSFYELSGQTVIDVFATIDGVDMDYVVAAGGQFTDSNKQVWEVVGFTLPASAAQAGGLVIEKGEVFFKRVVGE